MKNDKIKAVIDSKIFWIIVSLIASLILWAYVTSAENDTVSVTLRGVRLEFVGEEALKNSKNLVITDVDSSTVTVVIQGPRRTVVPLSAADITAQIDVSKLSLSSYTSLQYTISYPEGTNTSNLRVTSKDPETVGFVVSQNASKTIQVRGSFDGSLAEDCTAEPPTFEPSTVTVYGPEAYLKNVSYAWVSFGDSEINSSYSVQTGFSLMDSNGEECSSSHLTFSDEVITATLPILRTKQVPLAINLIEGGGATEANVKVTIEPETIKLAGDSSVLDGLNKITLGSVNLAEFNSSFTDTYQIVIDDSLKNLTGISEAKVTVEIVGLTTKTFTVNNISCINVTDGFEAEIVTKNLSVTLRGPEASLDQVQMENIRAVADLDDFKESDGVYIVNVKVYVDGFSDVGAFGETTITVELSKKSGDSA